MSMNVTTIVTISDSEAEHVFRCRLRAITRGYCISDGMLMEEQATSHTYWSKVEDVSSKQNQIIIAALKLQEALGL